MSRIAVIIPVYNAVDTLPRLLESLRRQTFRDFTAILVDDGSTDGSRSLIHDAGEADERVFLIEGAHGGPGAARNIGLDRAEEMDVEYVTFIDADDFILPDALEAAIRILDESHADIVHYPWTLDETGQNGSRPFSFTLPSIFVWNKTYRLSAISGIRFLQSKYAEDLAYHIEVEARSPRRVECPRALYVHVKHGSSLWESRSPEEVVRAMDAATMHIMGFLRSRSTLHVADDWRRYHAPRLLKHWWKSLRRLPRLYREEGKEAFLDRVAELRSAGQFPLFYSFEFRFRLRCLLMSALRPIGRWLRDVIDEFRARSYRRRYGRLLKRVRSKGSPVKIMFLVSEISKWKTRSLLDRMAGSSGYSPVVGVGLDDGELRLPVEDRKSLLERRMTWFRDRRIDCVAVSDAEKGRAVDLRMFSPDAVFYQQPWQIPKRHRPETVSRFALTFYVPYFLSHFGNLDAECLLPFFRQIFAYFVQSTAWATLYRSTARWHGCRFVATGHPMIDQFRRCDDETTSPNYGKSCIGMEDCIIYAPHWTFRHSGRNDIYPNGTFNGNGREILEYAKRHPEWRWVFKPHPLLRSSLVERGLMTRDEADSYYAEWGKIGTVCYDADYPLLFLKSRAMITDSGSFLVEYGATGHPLIHLRPFDSRIKALPPNRELFESYYVVTNLAEMYETFSTVLERREDPLGERRHAAARRVGLCNFLASERIVRYLDRIFKKED